MSDNTTTQSNTPATLPAGTKIAARSVEYSGDLDQLVAPVGLVEFSGADDAKVATDVAIGSILGAVDEAAPATDTASSGHNGRLQRIAQRLTSLLTPANTVQTALLALQSVAASSVAVGSAFTLSGKQGALVYVRFGRRAATAAGAGANIRIEASSSLTVDNSWHPLAQFTTAFAAASDEAVSGTVAAGATVITVAATAGFVAGDVIFIDNPTIGLSEWARIKSIVLNTSVTVEDALVNAATGATIYDAAEIYSPVWVPKGVLRVRVVDDGSLFTQAHAVEALLSTVDA